MTGDGHGVDVLPGDPAALGIGADLLDLPDEAVHQVPAEEDEVLGVRRVNVVAQGPEAAADPVHQIPRPLAEEGNLLALLLNHPRQLLHPGVPLVLQGVVDEDQAAVVRQVLQDLGDRLPLPFRGLEEVIVRDHQEGALAHHGQGVHRLPQALGGEGLSRQAVVVEALHPPGDELGLHLLQVVVPEVGLLPVKDIQGPQGPLAEVLFQFSIGRLAGGLGAFLAAFDHDR